MSWTSSTAGVYLVDNFNPGAGLDYRLQITDYTKRNVRGKKKKTLFKGIKKVCVFFFLNVSLILNLVGFSLGTLEI